MNHSTPREGGRTFSPGDDHKFGGRSVRKVTWTKENFLTNPLAHAVIKSVEIKTLYFDGVKVVGGWMGYVQKRSIP